MPEIKNKLEIIKNKFLKNEKKLINKNFSLKQFITENDNNDN